MSDEMPYRKSGPFPPTQKEWKWFWRSAGTTSAGIIFGLAIFGIRACINMPPAPPPEQAASQYIHVMYPQEDANRVTCIEQDYNHRKINVPNEYVCTFFIQNVPHKLLCHEQRCQSND